MNYISQQQHQQHQQQQQLLQQLQPQPQQQQSMPIQHLPQHFDFQQQYPIQPLQLPQLIPQQQHNESYDIYYQQQLQQQQYQQQQYYQQQQQVQQQVQQQQQEIHSQPQLIPHQYQQQVQQQQQQFLQNVKPSPLIEKLANVLPHPPLSMAIINPNSLSQTQPKRPRRRSKYTKEQDDMIVQLKKLGRSWVAIADITGVGSFLAARNRYQVLIGQQGGGTSECDLEDIMSLQSLIDEGELEKWRFLSKEMHKLTGKNFSDNELKDIIRMLFWSNPESFGVTEEYLKLYMKMKDVSSNNNSSSSNSSTPSSGNKSPFTLQNTGNINQQQAEYHQQRFNDDYYQSSQFQYNQ